MPRINLDQYVEKLLDENSIVFQVGDQEFTVPDPILWTDEQLDAAVTNAEKAVRMLIGDDGYEQFVAAGGRPAVLLRAVRDREELTAGESSAS